MKKLLLDLDGTVRRCKSNPTGFINSPHDQELIPRVAETVQRYYDDGWNLIYGVTNQGGVAARHKSLESCFEEQIYTMNLLPLLSGVMFCPDDGRTALLITRNRHCKITSGEYGNFRKPNPGMINYLIQYVEQDEPSQILFVGDMESDLLTAENAKVPFMWANEWNK